MEKLLNKRYETLDSLRGLASISVLFNHMWMVTPILPFIFSVSPIRILIYGHAAVILFFILSAFVLSHQLDNNKMSYPKYITKRICRIYIPYFFAISISIFLYNQFNLPIYNDFSEWFYKFWPTTISDGVIFEHFVLVANIHTDTFNTVIWSLVHEMRISIIFPFIFFMSKRCNLISIFTICVFLSGIASLNDLYRFEVSNGHQTSFFDTLHYCSIFLIGSTLYVRKDKIISTIVAMSSFIKVLLLSVGVFLYGYAKVSEMLIKGNFSHKVTEYVLTIGSCLIIVVCLGSLRLKTIMENKIFIFLGKISYSVYLLHFIIMISLLHIYGNVLNVYIIYIVSFLLSLISAYLFNVAIEQPSAKFGNWLTSLNFFNLVRG
ncbi:acyltransferase family protein [Pseudaeromonas sp. ZJS20]|uniref:acyltransferase family protein n=1 Tax=Pseudaeromonas aegiceratis TaxID=3153928 RepID=UPI00390C7EEA